MDIDLNILRDRAYLCACEHGFHEEDNSDEHFLMLVITELSEAIEADRKDIHADIETFKRHEEPFHQHFFKQCIKDSVEDEMSDIIIRLLDLAGLRGIDVTLSETELTVVRMLFFGHYNFTTVSYHLIGILHPNRYIEMGNIHDIICEAISFVLLWSKSLEFDIFQHINWKMEYNELRPKFNGKKY